MSYLFDEKVVLRGVEMGKGPWESKGAEGFLSVAASVANTMRFRQISKKRFNSKGGSCEEGKRRSKEGRSA